MTTDTPEFIDNSTERYIDLIHRFNKDKAFDYVIGLKDKDDKIIDRGFDEEVTDCDQLC